MLSLSYRVSFTVQKDVIATLFTYSSNLDSTDRKRAAGGSVADVATSGEVWAYIAKNACANRGWAVWWPVWEEWIKHEDIQLHCRHFFHLHLSKIFVLSSSYLCQFLQCILLSLECHFVIFPNSCPTLVPRKCFFWNESLTYSWETCLVPKIF